MIENVPDAAELEQTAIRLYFTAWDHVVQVILPLLSVRNLSVSVVDRKLTAVAYYADTFEIAEADAARDIERYIAGAQPDLHVCYALIQQSQEIALKARICSVSPFLLLLGTDVKSWAKPHADFTDFRTIDAVDLVRVVNAICADQVSEQFATKFDIVRRGRNKIQHLGSYPAAIDPIAALDILVDQWSDLFPNRNWLQEFANVTRNSHFFTVVHEGHGERWMMMSKVDDIDTLLDDKQRRKLLGFSKNSDLYRCWECFAASNWDDQGGDYSTASIEPGASKIVCRLCDAERQTRRATCISGCGCNIILTEGECAGWCVECGSNQHEVDRILGR